MEDTECHISDADDACDNPAVQALDISTDTELPVIWLLRHIIKVRPTTRGTVLSYQIRYNQQHHH